MQQRNRKHISLRVLARFCREQHLILQDTFIPPSPFSFYGFSRPYRSPVGYWWYIHCCYAASLTTLKSNDFYSRHGQIDGSKQFSLRLQITLSKVSHPFLAGPEHASSCVPQINRKPAFCRLGACLQRMTTCRAFFFFAAGGMWKQI